MGVPTAEKPPQGLDAYWLGVWRHALKVMQDQGTWRWELKPLLDEYVYALMGAEGARKGFKWLDALEVYAENADELPEIAWTTLAQVASGLPAQWDRHTKRATALADVLVLTERSRKAAGVGVDGPEKDEKPKDDWSDLYANSGAPSNVAPIRGRKAS